MTQSDAGAFDVVVIGGGLAGSIVATILARRRFRVLLVDRKQHPRFAIGESTIPMTSQRLSQLARAYDVPELHSLGLGSMDSLRAAVGARCGIKRTFGFAYHRWDAPPDPAEGLEFGNVWRDEKHFYRQDVDRYLFELAGRYGARTQAPVRVTAVETTPRRCEVTLNGNERVRARFVVDASGFRSVLAETMALRDTPTRLLHQSRCVFTHMAGVRPFEECVPSSLSVAWSRGTLHHLFDGGWIWVIPFDNWEGAENPLASVGLTVDPRAHPCDEQLGPEEEFFSCLSHLPSVRRQFENATAERPWVRTGRLQYSSSTAIGPRFCLLFHSAGFVDPLFSTGLTSALEVIATLIPRLTAALEADDFAVERFQQVDRVHRTLLDYADRLCHAAYLSWRSFRVWNAWMRVWAIGTGVAESNLGSVQMMGQLSPVRPVEDPVFSPYEGPGFRRLFEAAYDVVRRFGDGELSAEEASGGLWSLLGSYEFTMPLPDGVAGHEWALASPGCRDLFLGKPELQERWRRRLPDPLPAWSTSATCST